MYDTFYDDRTTIICKHCGAQNTFECGVQSKMFENVLDEYKVGDVVYSIHSSDCVEDYDWCDKCGKKLYVYFGFKFGIFTGIFETYEEAKESSETFDVIDRYRRLFYKNKKCKNRLDMLERKISTVINVHGKEPTTSTFNILFKFHNQFIDYDIIKTLKNIIADD